jgi:competence protein ComEC
VHPGGLSEQGERMANYFHAAAGDKIHRHGHLGRFASIVARLFYLISPLFFIEWCLLPTVSRLYAGDQVGSRIHFLNVGEGTSTWVEIGDGRHVLIDAGNVITGTDVRTALVAANVNRLEAVIITHPHPDHMGGIFHLLADFDIEEILDNRQPVPRLPPCDIYRWYVQAVRSHPHYKTLREGDRRTWGQMELEVLWPPCPSSNNWNDNALVLRIRVENELMLLMSDVGVDVESELLKKRSDLKSTVLLVGHHGAADASSEAFLRAVSPQWALISVDQDNVRGYPSPLTLQRLEAVGAKVLLTKTHGTCIWSFGEGMKCEEGLGIER